MGAEEFDIIKKGKSAKEAFEIAIEEAKYLYGNDGYTGTIAEKNSFILIQMPKEIKDHMDFLSKCWNFEDEGTEEKYIEIYKKACNILNDKWGPCLCFDLGNDFYLFAGLASS